MSKYIYIIDDIWKLIKNFLFHKIRIHGKHIQIKNINIRKYNNLLKNIPRYFILSKDSNMRRKIIIRPFNKIPSIIFVYGINNGLKNKMGFCKTRYIYNYFNYPIHEYSIFFPVLDPFRSVPSCLGNVGTRRSLIGIGAKAPNSDRAKALS